MQSLADALDVVRTLADENGNMALRVFVETALKEMHRKHLGALTDQGCVAYQKELEAQGVIEPDPAALAGYVFKKKRPRIFNKPKAMIHYAQW